MCCKSFRCDIGRYYSSTECKPCPAGKFRNASMLDWQLCALAKARHPSVSKTSEHDRVIEECSPGFGSFVESPLMQRLVVQSCCGVTMRLSTIKAFVNLGKQTALTASSAVTRRSLACRLVLAARKAGVLAEHIACRVFLLRPGWAYFVLHLPSSGCQFCKQTRHISTWQDTNAWLSAGNYANHTGLSECYGCPQGRFSSAFAQMG